MIFRCQVFPHPKLVDPLEGVGGPDRIHRLREMFSSVCDFLISEKGLNATPSAGAPCRLNEAHFTVDPTLAKSRTGLQGVTTITVAHAEDGMEMETAATDGFDIDALYPVIAVCFHGTDTWSDGAGSLPFFDELIRLMNVDWLVFGHAVEYEEGDLGHP